MVARHSMVPFPAKTKGKKTSERVSSTSLVPHSRRFSSLYKQVDQGSLLLYAEQCSCGEIKCEHGWEKKIVTFFDLKKCASVHDSRSIRSIRELIRIAIERAVLLERCLHQLRRWNPTATFKDARERIEKWRVSTRFFSCIARARELLNRFRRRKGRVKQILHGYSPEQVLDGIACSVPPYAFA